MVHVDDLIEPRTKQILLAALPTLPWPHRKSLRSIPANEENHSFRFEGIPNMNLQENRRRSPNFRQIQLQQFRRFLLPVKHFRILHGRLTSLIPLGAAYAKPLAYPVKCNRRGRCSYWRNGFISGELFF